MDWFANLFKDGSWLSNAFSGENFGNSISGIGKGVGAFAEYKAADAKEKFDNKLFGLQEQQYNNLLKDQEEEKKRRDRVDNGLASVWG